MEEVLQKDPKIFFLNNLLMSVQFFENYERDVELLRQNWFKEFSIESHNKKCFYADSLFKLIGRNVKFSPPQNDKSFATQLHPLRIYVSSDNVEAAYDPSVLKSNERVIVPQYQFIVKPAEENEKSGYVTLVELKRREARNANKRAYTVANINKLHDTVNSYENTEENSSASLEKLHSREVKTKISGRQSSFRFYPSAEAALPANGFYEHTNSEATLKRKTVQDFRMNSFLTTSHEIPVQCFQMEEVKRKINSRRVVFRECTRTQKVLKSTAFKAYFCDLLIEKLAESLHLDKKAVNESTISGEFIVVDQEGTRFHIAPAIPVRDWNNFVTINKKHRALGTTEQIVWPSNYMQKVIHLLPCNAVPTAPSQFFEDNARHEKTWTLVFPKAEEFLLLHMMHAHVRCFLFALLLYKSFIESEVSGASFGPKHLMHLLFWRVQKNFFAWPEDRPAETLLNFLKVLYKKLQNKSLSDFFITSRNLFAGSLAKDLHKAQALIKRIIENPVLYIGNAVRNLVLEPNYYPGFDVLNLKNSLKEVNTQVACKGKGKGKGEKKKDVQRVQEDEKSFWKKNAINSTELIDVEEILDFNSPNSKKCSRLLETFTSHLVRMGFKSLEYDFLSQALLYLSHSEKLFEFKLSHEINEAILCSPRKKILDLREACYTKLKTDFPKLSLKQFQAALAKPRKNFGALQREEEEERKHQNFASSQGRQSQDETVGSDERDFNDDEVITVKL